MFSLNNRYKLLDQSDGIFSFEKSKNAPLKITARNNHVKYIFIEKNTICCRIDGVEQQKDFEDKVVVSVYLDEGNVAVLGSECYSAELDKSRIKKVDILYVFFPQNGGNYSCYVFDMKHTYGHEKKDILRFYDWKVSFVLWIMRLKRFKMLKN